MNRGALCANLFTVFDSLRSTTAGTTANDSTACSLDRLVADVSLQFTYGVKHWLGELRYAAAYPLSLCSLRYSSRIISNGVLLAPILRHHLKQHEN